MDYLISMFIDDEMELDEKMEFLKKAHKDDDFFDETMELLQQERLIRSAPVRSFPLIRPEEKKRGFDLSLFKSLRLLASVGTIAAVMIFFILSIQEKAPVSIHHRFIIYKPEVNKVEISGSFTDWKVLQLEKIGSTAYWQIELDIPNGEHRYTYILDDKEKVADPTILTREKDDFGGENSVLLVET
jgi:hypothetical protein